MEWGFQGRRNIKESDIDCAVREFEEESGYKKNSYKIITDIEREEELFSGTNNIRYKHIYYIGQSLYDAPLYVNKDNFSQVSEISNINWFTFEEAISKIRDYNKEKKEALNRSHYKILEYLKS